MKIFEKTIDLKNLYALYQFNIKLNEAIQFLRKDKKLAFNI